MTTMKSLFGLLVTLAIAGGFYALTLILQAILKGDGALDYFKDWDFLTSFTLAHALVAGFCLWLCLTTVKIKNAGKAWLLAIVFAVLSAALMFSMESVSYSVSGETKINRAFVETAAKEVKADWLQERNMTFSWTRRTHVFSIPVSLFINWVSFGATVLMLLLFVVILRNKNDGRQIQLGTSQFLFLLVLLIPVYFMYVENYLDWGSSNNEMINTIKAAMPKQSLPDFLRFVASEMLSMRRFIIVLNFTAIVMLIIRGPLMDGKSKSSSDS